MRFSWTGLILAPLVVPLVLSAALVAYFGDERPVFEFLILFIPGCIVSYGVTIFLFLPSLFLLSLWRPMTGWRVCLLGLLLGAATFVPMTLMFWKGSGPDSGPPIESFFSFSIHWAASPLTEVYPFAGLVTAGLYWWLGTWRHARSAPNG
jgi:hypothetical protein